MSLSTHVLDAAEGLPAAGLPVRLERADGTTAADGATDADGRWRAPDGVPGIGEHRLVVDVTAHQEERAREVLHPRVEIVVRVTDPDRHLHLPVLLSPYAYTTYRGS